MSLKLDGIDNVYLAGAWSTPGGGQSAVLMSGYSVAQKIIKKENGDGKIDSFMRFIFGVIGFITGIFY